MRAEHPAKIAGGEENEAGGAPNARTTTELNYCPIQMKEEILPRTSSLIMGWGVFKP